MYSDVSSSHDFCGVVWGVVRLGPVGAAVPDAATPFSCSPGASCSFATTGPKLLITGVLSVHSLAFPPRDAGHLPRCEAELPLVRLFVDRTQTGLDLPHRFWHPWRLRLDRVLADRFLAVYGRDLRCRCRASGDLGCVPLLRGFLGGARLLPARDHVASVGDGERLDVNCRDRVQVIEILRGGAWVIRRRNFAEPETSLRVLRAFPGYAVSASFACGSRHY